MIRNCTGPDHRVPWVAASDDYTVKVVGSAFSYHFGGLGEAFSRLAASCEEVHVASGESEDSATTRDMQEVQHRDSPDRTPSCGALSYGDTKRATRHERLGAAVVTTVLQCNAMHVSSTTAYQNA